MGAAISVKNVSFTYPGHERKALDNVTMEIEEGSFTVILGRNGSGKSTLAKLFNALLLPTEGRVYVKGMDTSEHTHAVRKCAGMVFQNPDNQFVASVVEDDVAFAPENLCVEPTEIRRRVDRALRTVGLEEYARCSIAALSGGQKQKTAIAGVLAMEPEIIIFDESTAMLDPRGRREVLETAERLNRDKNITVILVTHFMEEAAEADRAIVLDEGTVALDGTVREVFSDEERIASLGLRLPTAARLARELTALGIDAPKGILTADKLLEFLEEKIGRNRINTEVLYEGNK